MKRKILLFAVLLSMPFVLNAQDDDDMYFVPSKKKAQTSSINRNNVKVVERNANDDADANADYHTGALRNSDDYNRRSGSNPSGVSARIVNDTLYVNTDSATVESYPLTEQGNEYSGDNYYDDDYCYSNRLSRYHGYHYYDPIMWDIAFGFYDPWFDPWYGYYGPYFRLGWSSWYDWGWGPMWSWHPYGYGWGCFHHHYYGWGYGPGHPGLHHGNYRAAQYGGRRPVAGRNSLASRGGVRGGRLGNNMAAGTRSGVNRSLNGGRSTVNGGRSTGRSGNSSASLSRGGRSSSPSGVSRSSSSTSSPRSSGGSVGRSGGFSSGGRSGGGFSGGGHSGGHGGGFGGGGRGGR